MLGEYSQSNIFPRRVLGLYLYASGAQRQVISVMSHLGISESYSTLVRKLRKASVVAPIHDGTTTLHTANPAVPVNIQNEYAPAPIASNLSAPAPKKAKARNARVPQPWDAGTLRVLSNSMRDMARGVAATGLFASVYDNINMVFQVSEQIMGRTGVFLSYSKLSIH